MAVASDLNPGTSYCEGLSVPMWLATSHYGMTVDETCLGVNRHAAAALDRRDRGVIAAGTHADLVLWHTDHPADVPYQLTANLVNTVLLAGTRADPT